MKILQIDDNENTLEPVQIIFESDGFEYDKATGGREGLELIRKNNYDVVLLDLTMPEFSGYDVMDALEKDGLMDKQKIVVFSGYYLNNAEVENFAKRGVHSILQKPIQMEDLEAKVLEIAKGNKIIMEDV